MTVRVATGIEDDHITLLGQVPAAMVDEENTVNPCIPTFALHLPFEEADAFDAYIRQPREYGSGTSTASGRSGYEMASASLSSASTCNGPTTRPDRSSCRPRCGIRGRHIGVPTVTRDWPS